MSDHCTMEGSLCAGTKHSRILANSVLWQLCEGVCMCDHYSHFTDGKLIARGYKSLVQTWQLERGEARTQTQVQGPVLVLPLLYGRGAHVCVVCRPSVCARGGLVVVREQHESVRWQWVLCGWRVRLERARNGTLTLNRYKSPGPRQSHKGRWGFCNGTPCSFYQVTLRTSISKLLKRKNSADTWVGG